MKNNDGRFKPGEHRSPETEFQPGQHWREHKPYWERDWLYNQYVVLGKSAADIAVEWGITANAINFWLKKHDIPTRTTKETRAIKHWGLNGKDNPMYGRTGELSPTWRGGASPERQSFYSSSEWKKAARAVRKRDKRTCQRCGRGERPWAREFHHIHHIVSFSVEDLRASIDNLILLCVDCHRWVHGTDNINKEFLREEVREC